MESETQKSRESIESTGRHAVETYLQWGGDIPPQHMLKHMIEEMSGARTNLYVRSVCAGAYLDLARHPDTSPQEVGPLLRKSARRLGTLSDKNHDKLANEEVDHIYRAELQRVYGGKYTKALSGEIPDIDDEAQLFYGLLELGTWTLERSWLEGGTGGRIRGVQFEIGVHLLNARFNLKHGTLMQHMWPSLPREDSPHGRKRDGRKTGWDAATSTVGFLRDDEIQYLQLKSGQQAGGYVPEIKIVAGKDHLKVASPEDIINMMLQQEYPMSEAERVEAETKLDTFERNFLVRLGWKFPKQ